MLIIKLAGLLMFAFCCGMLGFLKARQIEQRVLILEQIYSSIDMLKERISYSADELSVLLEKSFSESGAIAFKGGKPWSYSDVLEKADMDLLEDFFSRLGGGNVESECARITLFEEILHNKILKLREQSAQKAKLCRTFGVCIGLAGAVILI